MAANFDICDKKLINNINQIENCMSDDDENWDEIENYDEIETWMTQVENDDKCESRNDEAVRQEQNSMDYSENTDEKMLNFIQDQRSTNTKLKTKYDIKRFKEFLQKQGENRKPEDIPPTTLDGLIGHFLMDLKKRDGTPYEPGSITGFHR